jgi:hypothetical protein
MYSNELISKSQCENEQKDLSNSFMPDISLTQKLESYEQTIDQLRHEISRLSSKNKLDSAPIENFSYKYYSLSTELSKCLQSSGYELSKFTSSYDQAIKSLKTFGSGFSSILSKMRSNLSSSSKSLLNFMHSILDELQDLRAQLTIMQNYLAVLEFNEASLRESLSKLEKRNLVTRSVSVSRMEQLSRSESFKSDFVFDFAPKIVNEDIRDKINKLILRNCKMKNLKNRAEIDKERLLLQLKQAKEQIAISEEEAANRELALEIRCQNMAEILQRLKDIPSFKQIVLGIEAEVQRSKKIHSRTKSGIVMYNE